MCKTGKDGHWRNGHEGKPRYGQALKAPRFVRLQADQIMEKSIATTDCTCHLQVQHNNIRFSKTTAVLGPAHSAVNWQEVEHSSRRSCELVSKI
jgi:hypothetical protein